MRTGIATIPLDYGKCPRWLFERMKRLSRAIALAIVEEFGSEEFLRRLANPIWFQSLGCVIGFDWNSSGLTTTTLGALKASLFDIQDELGIYVCGGKKESRKTPSEIEAYSLSRGFSFGPDLIYASKMAAKVDSALIQDNYQIYQHNFLFTRNGQWTVVQQGMNIFNQTARRYHWLSDNIRNFVEEPHSGIIAAKKVKPLNLVSKESRTNKEIAVELVKEEPKTFLMDIKLISTKPNSLIRQKRSGNFTEMELNNVEFHWHPVEKEKFDLKRLANTIFAAHQEKPQNFEQLLSLKGVGPKTIRALSLVAELVYGAAPSYEDPARYSFTVGGKDGTPYFVERDTYDSLLRVIERGIERAKVSLREKNEAKLRLSNLCQK
ncbi:MAG: DUF763 domain-containing protein [Minisyncoccales bacterium]